MVSRIKVGRRLLAQLSYLFPLFLAFDLAIAQSELELPSAVRCRYFFQLLLLSSAIRCSKSHNFLLPDEVSSLLYSALQHSREHKPGDVVRTLASMLFRSLNTDITTWQCCGCESKAVRTGTEHSTIRSLDI